MARESSSDSANPRRGASRTALGSSRPRILLARVLLFFPVMKTSDTTQSGLQRDPDDWKTGDEPATPAQRSYLETLANDRGETVDENLTKAEASKKSTNCVNGRPGWQRSRRAAAESPRGPVAALDKRFVRPSGLLRWTDRTPLHRHRRSRFTERAPAGVSPTSCSLILIRSIRERGQRRAPKAYPPGAT